MSNNDAYNEAIKEHYKGFLCMNHNSDAPCFGEGGHHWIKHKATEDTAKHAEAVTLADSLHRRPSFEARATRIGKLVDEKNKAYGDSFSKSGAVLAIIYPEGIKPEQYKDALGMVRVIDKLFRIAARKDAFGENPWDDLCGYGVVAGGKE